MGADLSTAETEILPNFNICPGTGEKRGEGKVYSSDMDIWAKGGYNRFDFFCFEFDF